MNVIVPEHVFPVRCLQNAALGSVLLAKYLHQKRARKVVVKNTSITDAEKEIDILTRLKDCPHVVKLIGVCEAGGFEPELPYLLRPSQRALVLEYASRGDIFDCLSTRKKTRFGEGVAARIVEQVLGALVACHEIGIVHLDVKTENVFIRRDGSAILGDFGMSEKVGTPIHSYRGTLEFMPPEIMMCKFGEETVAAHPSMDMWCLGIFCLEILNGKNLVYELKPPEDVAIAKVLSAARKRGSKLTIGQLKVLFSYCVSAEGIRVRTDAFDGVSALARQFILSLCCGDASKRPDAESCLRENAWIQMHKFPNGNCRKRKTLKEATDIHDRRPLHPEPFDTRPPDEPEVKPPESEAEAETKTEPPAEAKAEAEREGAKVKKNSGRSGRCKRTWVDVAHAEMAVPLGMEGFGSEDCMFTFNSDFSLSSMG